MKLMSMYHKLAIIALVSLTPVSLLVGLQDFKTTFDKAIASFHQQQYDTAIAEFEQALLIDNSCAPAHFNLGLIYLIKEQPEKAVGFFKQAANADANYIKAYLFLGDTSIKLRLWDQAIGAYQHVITHDPRNAQAHFALARALREQDKHDEAIISYLRVLNLDKTNLQAQFELANEYTTAGNLDQAQGLYEQILIHHPGLVDVACNLAHVLRYKGLMHDAIKFYKQFLVTNSDNPHAHYGLAESYLTIGNLEAGFAEFQWRLKRMADTRKMQERVWNGVDDIAGKTILLRAEYGQGDTLQFIRYAQMLKERGATVIVESQNTLCQLLSLCPYIDKVIPVYEQLAALPHCDLQIPIMSLPHLFKTTRSTVPAQMPYLHADPALVEYWKIKLAHDKKFKIGICWEGSPYYDSLRPPLSKKSIPLKLLSQLASIEGVSVYSLQKMDGVEQLNNLPAQVTIRSFGNDFDNQHGRFMDTAALIKNLDLIVTVDTSVTHLAGGLGAKVWVLLPYVADWRWMQDCTDTPWYPSMHLFRQPYPNDWESVIEEVKDKVTALLIKRSPKTASPVVEAEIAIGELLDKITILDIKMERIKDAAKLKNIKKELDVLMETYNEYVTRSPELDQLVQKLKDTNAKMWVIEDDIRDKERVHAFDNQFVELARAVYYTNDERCRIKRQINEFCGSRLIEEKSYQAY